MAKKEHLPQDTDITIYIEHFEVYSIQDLICIAQAKWGTDVNLSNLKIEFEEIQVSCFGYDLYDPIDYRKYYIITLVDNGGVL